MAIEVFDFFDIPKIDNWVADPMHTIFTTTKNFIIAPAGRTIGLVSESIDLFLMRAKKCYNAEKLRVHFCKILNYFEAYFDSDKEYLCNMSRIKYMIDFVPVYSKESFIADLKVYILGESIRKKVKDLVEYNYDMNLSYNNISAPLQYTNDHAKYMLEMSIMMDLVIPLSTHFAAKKRIGEIDEFLLDVFDIILYIFPTVDMFSKFYETGISNVGKSENKNIMLWGKQDIRGKDVVTHSIDSVDNIILNIMPKYAFSRNVVSLNYTSIQKNTNCQVIEIGWEFGYVSLSSSKREGDENTSEFDKYESNMIKDSEAVYLQCKVNSAETMKTIDAQFGPFSDEEITFYRENLKNDAGNYINNFQKQLIFDLFYKYFGDTKAIYAIKPATDYIKLMLAAKKILMNNYMIIMPYIISGKVEKIVTRKTINKREEKDLLSSAYYPLLIEKYRNPKIIQQILSTFATVISSTFRIVDHEHPELHGTIIDATPAIVLEELQLMTLLY